MPRHQLATHQHHLQQQLWRPRGWTLGQGGLYNQLQSNFRESLDSSINIVFLSNEHIRASLSIVWHSYICSAKHCVYHNILCICWFRELLVEQPSNYNEQVRIFQLFVDLFCFSRCTQFWGLMLCGAIRNCVSELLGGLWIQNCCRHFCPPWLFTYMITSKPAQTLFRSVDTCSNFASGHSWLTWDGYFYVSWRGRGRRSPAGQSGAPTSTSPPVKASTSAPLTWMQ